MTVKELLDKVGLKNCSTVRWGEEVWTGMSGVYVVSSNIAPEDGTGAGNIEFDENAINHWIKRLPDFTIDGLLPTEEAIEKRLSEFWIPEENILYIGMTQSSLSKRIHGYYITGIGDRRPHSGGQWLKTLKNISGLYVHYATVSLPEQAPWAEEKLLGYFIEETGRLPFANLEGPCGRKQHGLKNQREKK